MWLYIQAWLPLVAITLSAAIGFTVLSFMVGHDRPIATAGPVLVPLSASPTEIIDARGRAIAETRR